MKFNIVWSCLLMFMMTSCRKMESKTPDSIPVESSTVNSKKDSPYQDTSKEKPKPTIFNENFLELENVSVNEKNIVLSADDFEKLYPKKDSVKIEIWDCGSPFEWLDKIWMEKTYGKDLINFDGKITTFYTHNAEFISNKHKVLFSQAKTGDNHFEIKSHHIVLTDQTTVDEFQKLFPKIKGDDTDQNNTIVFRIPISKDIEDSFEFYFVNEKLKRFNLWWLLC